MRFAWPILIASSVASASPSQRLAVDALGPDLAADGVRITEDKRVVACLTRTGSITCLVFEPSGPFSLGVLSREAAQAIDRGDASTSTKAALQHDMAIFRDKLGTKSRAFHRTCSGAKQVACAGVTVAADGSLDVPDANDSMLAFDDVPSCGVHLTHGEIWTDATTRTLFVVEDVQSDCDKARTTIVHRITPP